MDDYMLMKFLEEQGGNKSNMMDKFKEFIMSEKYARGGRGRGRMGSRRHQGFDEFDEFDAFDKHRNLDMFDEFYTKRHNSPEEFIDMFVSQGGDKYELLEELKRTEGGHHMMEHRNSSGEHFNESYAKYVVSKMYHIEDGRKYVGEKFDMAKAKEVCERYRGIIPQSITHADVYVAINAQYHDYCELFKSWFGDNIDLKIIESAIIFWFKDDDYKGVKIWKYFKED